MENIGNEVLITLIKSNCLFKIERISFECTCHCNNGFFKVEDFDFDSDEVKNTDVIEIRRYCAPTVSDADTLRILF